MTEIIMITGILTVLSLIVVIAFWFGMVKYGTNIERIKEGSVLVCLFGIIAGMFLTLHIEEIKTKEHIKPIDVYRGKTTLKVEYKNGIPSDSSVVWKDEEQINYQYQ